VLLGTLDLALDGTITGSGPSGQKGAERGTRQTQERAGWQPYSIKVGDRYFSYKRTDPIGMTLGIAADLAEIINNASLDEDKQEEILELTMAAAASFGYQVLEKTYMSGLSEFIDVLHNPQRAEGFAARTIAGFVPAGVGEVRRQVDPYMRYTHDIVTALKNRTPGLSADLPVARDMWGRPRVFESGLGKTYDAVSPIASRLESPEPIDREAMLHDFNMAMPDWRLSYGQGVNVSLRNRPEAYSRFLELRGQVRPSDMGDDNRDAVRLIRKYGDAPLLDTLNTIVAGKHKLSAEYEEAGSGRGGGKDEMITRIVSDYGRAAKARITEEFADVADTAARKRAKLEASR